MFKIVDKRRNLSCEEKIGLFAKYIACILADSECINEIGFALKTGSAYTLIYNRTRNTY
jgi:hypothetical protein